jgi:hypothetical protein
MDKHSKSIVSAIGADPAGLTTAAGLFWTGD